MCNYFLLSILAGFYVLLHVPPQPLRGFPGDSVVKKPPASVEDTDSIPASGRCPGEVNGNPLQYSCLENPMDRGAWWATVHMWSQKSWTQLSD